MAQWGLGETRYVYTSVTASTGTITITSATYQVIDVDDEEVVASGAATVNDSTIYCKWTPTEVGTFLVQFDYLIGEETFKSSQVIEVKETM